MPFLTKSASLLATALLIALVAMPASARVTGPEGYAVVAKEAQRIDALTCAVERVEMRPPVLAADDCLCRASDVGVELERLAEVELGNVLRQVARCAEHSQRATHAADEVAEYAVNIE